MELCAVSARFTRVSYDAVRRLRAKGHEVVAVGLREANIFGVDIQKGQPQVEEVDTITLYLNPERQKIVCIKSDQWKGTQA